MTDVEAPPLTDVPGWSPDAVSGMDRAGARPSLPRYVAQLWERRHFIVSYTRANNEVVYSQSFLGQFWQVLTPLLNAGVYYLIFGLLLKTNRGVHNFVAFLVIGIFVFHYVQNSILSGAKSISSNQGLIRSLHFPRAALPISTTGQTLIQLLVSLVVLVPIVLLTGEPVTWRWLTLPIVVVLATFFALGGSLVLARIGAHVPDTTALLPFIMRTWLYFSGIFYSIEHFTKHRHWLRILLELNPGATYVELARSALLTGQHVSSYMWLVAVGWAIVASGLGLLYFWSGEETYARG